MIKDMTKTITVDLKEILEKEEKEYVKLADELISKIVDKRDDEDISDIAKGLAYMMDCLRARMHLLYELGLLTEEEVDKIVNYFKELTLERTEKPYEDYIEEHSKVDADGFDWNLGDYTIHVRCVGKEN